MSARTPARRGPPVARPPAVVPRRIGRSRRSRLVWGGGAALLAVLLVVSTVMARRAFSHEEEGATSRATSLAEGVLFPALTPTLVSRPITGDDYKNLLTVVRAGILDDERILRLRIWKPDGTLLFSTDQRDRIGQAFGVVRDRISRVVEGSGQAISRVTGETVAPKVGLDGSTERLFETYVPVRLPGEVDVLAAAQFDTPYAAIDQAANRVWRPVQIALLIALVFCLVSLVLSLRTGTVGRVAGFEPSHGPSDRALEAERRKAEERIRRAEEAMREAQARLSASEEKVREVAAASRVLEGKLEEAERRIPELEAALARSREELMHARQQPPADVTRVQAELQKSYERLQLVEVELTQAAERARLAEERLSQSEAERAGLEAAQVRLTEQLEAAQERGFEEAELREVEERLRQAEERLAGTEAELQRVSERAAEAEEALAAKDLEAERTAELAGQAEERAREAEERAREAEERAREAEARLREADADRRALADEVESLRAAPALTEEIQRLEGQLRLAEEQLHRAEESLAGKEAELRQAAERGRHLEERLAEGGAERQRLAAELHRTQEKLANREFELAQAVKGLRDPEAGPGQPDASGEAGPEEPVPPEGGLPSAPGQEEEAAGSEGEPSEEEEPAPSEEAESLRSRLTRAAAMRHGGAVTSPPSGAGSR